MTLSGHRCQGEGRPHSDDKGNADHACLLVVYAEPLFLRPAVYFYPAGPGRRGLYLAWERATASKRGQMPRLHGHRVISRVPPVIIR